MTRGRDEGRGRLRSDRAWGSHGLAALLALLAVFSLAPACSKSGRPAVDKVVVNVTDGLDVLGLSKDDVSKRITAALVAAKFTMLDEGESPPEGAKPWRVIAAVKAEEPDPDSGARPKVACALSLHQKGGSESWETEGHARLEARSNSIDDIQQAARDGFARSLERAVAEAKAVVELLAAKDEAVVEKLAGPPGASQEAAVLVLARRHNPAALKVLIEWLGSDDVEVVHQAMGLLVEMKARDAVSPLIEAAHGKDATFEREVVFALGEIGGDEAEAYLFTLAQGHDDPIVRASAERALEDLKQKRTMKARPGDSP